MVVLWWCVESHPFWLKTFWVFPNQVLDSLLEVCSEVHPCKWRLEGTQLVQLYPSGNSHTPDHHMAYASPFCETTAFWTHSPLSFFSSHHTLRNQWFHSNQSYPSPLITLQECVPWEPGPKLDQPQNLANLDELQSLYIYQPSLGVIRKRGTLYHHGASLYHKWFYKCPEFHQVWEPSHLCSQYPRKSYM